MSATAYVNFPNTYKKYVDLYNKIGRRKKVKNEQFSEHLNMSTASTNNYIYGGAQLELIDRISTSTFIISVRMVVLMKLQKKYHHELVGIMLKDEILRKVVIKFGNKIPALENSPIFWRNILDFHRHSK